MTTKGWKNQADALTAYGQLERLVGLDKIPLPKDETSPEWDTVYNKLGRPESAEKYAFKAPDGVEIDPTLDKMFRETVWKAGATEKVAKAVYDLWNDTMKGAQESFTAALKADVETKMNALRTEWGPAFDAKYDMLNRVAGAAFGDAITEARQLRLADGSFLLDHPIMAKAFATIGEQWAEPGRLPADIKNAMIFAKSPKEAEAEADRIMDIENGPYWDKHHPEHAATVARVQELIAIASAEEPGQ